MLSVEWDVAWRINSPSFVSLSYFNRNRGYEEHLVCVCCALRHLQRNPENQLYPIFEYFENWCQDESRHGDFFTAMLKSQPDLLDDWQAKLWSRFFCLSVYITMYLNDHQRTSFYEAIGLNTTQFNQHVIIETNKTTARIFPEVPDCEHPEFFVKLDKLRDLNMELLEIGNSDAPDALKNIQKVPLIAQMVTIVLDVFLMKPLDAGSWDFKTESQLAY